MKAKGRKLLRQARQAKFPKEFRLPIDDALDSATALVDLAICGLHRLEVTEKAEGAAPPAPSLPPRDGNGAGRAESGLTANAEFAASLANEVFRIDRNAKQMADEGNDTRPLRGIRRALERIGELLGEQGIECLAVDGQLYDLGRQDIEIIGDPVEQSGLKAMMVGACERPVVILNGQLIQRARAVILRPAPNAKSSPQ